MSKFFRRSVSPIVAMTGILAMTMAAPARADLVIELSTNGTSWTTVASGTSGTAAGYGFPATATFNGFSIQALTTSSNSPGSSGFADLLGSDTSITNKNSGTATLYIKMGDTGFTDPYTPGTISVDSHVGGTVIKSGTANLMTFQSYIDPTDGQNSTAGFTPGAQNSTNGLTITNGSFSNDAFTSITSGLTNPYSVTEYFKVTLSKGSEINFSSSTTLASAVPEPSTLVLSSISVLGLIGYSLRRRKAKGA